MCGFICVCVFVHVCVCPIGFRQTRTKHPCLAAHLSDKLPKIPSATHTHTLTPTHTHRLVSLSPDFSVYQMESDHVTLVKPPLNENAQSVPQCMLYCIYMWGVYGPRVWTSNLSSISAMLMDWASSDETNPASKVGCDYWPNNVTESQSKSGNTKGAQVLTWWSGLDVGLTWWHEAFLQNSPGNTLSDVLS